MEGYRFLGVLEVLEFFRSWSSKGLGVLKVLEF
jgi:hypothetical protein